MMSKYEAHITFDKQYAEKLKPGLATSTVNWQYSAIDDDPIMGQKPYCYWTGYSSDPNVLLGSMQAVSWALTGSGVPVLRQKIERIIYDTKTGVDELTDGK